MKKTLTLLLLWMGVLNVANAQTVSLHGQNSNDGVNVSGVSPALSRYINESIENDLWKRPQLSSRERSIVTVAALIARNQTIELRSEIFHALADGVKPSEISEIITHLAFYAGLGNAKAAIAVTAKVFAECKIGVDQLPPALPRLLPIDEKAEERRAGIVARDVRPVSPALEHFTNDPLFHDLWLRPGLSPRDRSLVTVTSLIANGQLGQVAFHLNKAMDGGLTRKQIGEVIAQIAFYAGWPNAYGAVAIAAQVMDSRPK
ncbi:4-carboxymuconolactone decarboxylase [Caballeronia calidae]|uniref:4-carboxymuconolactone decarboxylase n=1 Tax=Caballeronia calidae TaxID=1777139 RepID=A0A158E5Q7_9BURK|nr:carboxymuconolactone decarboxylase family protein [Caballeronia calidae]SAL01766.1 4-carboxymuconolactone decarboxylase [Caballeronia calidae]